MIGDFDSKLRTAKENYEQRVQALNSKVAKIYQEVQDDEVIATMRDDPASNAFTPLRLKEICEDNLASEREETIERLISEISELKPQVETFQKELEYAKKAIDRTELILELSSSSGSLTERLHKLCEGVKDRLDSTDERLTALADDLKFCKKNNEKASNEYEKMTSELLSAHKKTQRLEEELEQSQYEWRNSYEMALAENNKLKDSLHRAEREKNDKDILLEKVKLEMTDSFDQERKDAKEKASRLKKKLIELRQVVFIHKKELEEKTQFVEHTQNQYELTLKALEEELNQVKAKWARRCEEVEENSHKQIQTLTQTHQTQLATLQKHYQQLLDENIHKFQQETELLNKKQEEKNAEVERNFISKAEHEGLMKQLQREMAHERQQAEELRADETMNKMKDIRKDHLQELNNLEGKIQSLEQSNLEMQIGKRETSSKLDIALSTIEHLNSRIDILKSELQEVEDTKKKLSREIDDTREDVSKHKSLHSQECIKSSRLEAELNESLTQATQAQHTITRLNGNLKELEGKLTMSQENTKKWEQSYNKLESEVEHIKFSQETTAKKSEMNIRNLEEAVESYKREKHVTNGKLESLEFELTNSKKRENECKAIIENYEKKVNELSRQVEETEGNFHDTKTQLFHAQQNFTKNRTERLQKSQTNQKKIKKHIKSIQTEFKKFVGETQDSLKNFDKIFVFGTREMINSLKEHYSKQINDLKVSRYAEKRNSKEFEQENAHLALENTSLRQEIASLQEKVEDLRTEKHSEKLRLEEDKRRVEGELNAIISSLKAQREFQDTSHFSSKEEAQKQQSLLIKAHQKEIAHFSSKVNEMQKQFDSAVSSFEQRIIELQEAHKAENDSIVVYYDAKIQDKNREIASVKEELRVLEKKTNDILGKMESDLKELQENIELEKERTYKMKFSKNSEIEAYRKECKTLKNQLEDMKEFVEKIENEKDSLRRELRTLRDSYGMDDMKNRLTQSYHFRKNESDALSMSQLKASLNQY